MSDNASGALNWRLSAHPITLLCYLGFRTGTLSRRSSCAQVLEAVRLNAHDLVFILLFVTG